MEVKRMRVPSKTACLRLICEMEMLEHIVAHSLKVARVAMLLVDHLDGGQLTLDRDRVRASALLHDITKTRSFTTGENHAETGGRFLTEMGFPRIGEIIRQHVKLDRYFASGLPDEAEIVNYADKRVLHDQVVTLEDRMAYILERYGTQPVYREKIRWLWDQSQAVEQRIFSLISFSPDEVAQRIDAMACDRDMADYRHIHGSIHLDALEVERW
jgi:uncharacterized protein